MVGTKATAKRRRAVFAVALLCLLCQAGTYAAAQGLGEEGEFSLREECRVEIDAEGDARITDVIAYDQAWFDEYGYIFKENPNLLSRRYRSVSNVGEVENFDVDINARKASVTISFYTPGFAYNLADGWTVFGYGDYELVSESDGEVVLEAAWSFNNEWTLFETMALEERVVIDLPSGAQGVRFSEDAGTITYDLPVAKMGEGFLAANRTALVTVFALAMALSLLLLLFLFTRRTAPQAAQAPYPPSAAWDMTETAASPRPAVTAIPQDATPPAGATEPALGKPQPYAGTEAPPMGTAVPHARSETPAVDEGAAPEGVPGGETMARAGEVKLFCDKCGHPRGPAEEKFCRRCGAPQS